MVSAFFGVAGVFSLVASPVPRPVAPALHRVSMPVTMICTWEAMMHENCEPTAEALRALAKQHSPAVELDWQRRESVRVLEVDEEAISIEEVICDETHCIALTHVIARDHAVQAMESDEAGNTMASESAKHLCELVQMLNQSPALVKALAHRHTAAEQLRPTDMLEYATVRDISMNAVIVELSAVDLIEMAEGGEHMPRRKLIATVPLPRSCVSVVEVEEALLEMIDLIMMAEDDATAAPDVWI